MSNQLSHVLDMKFNILFVSKLILDIVRSL